MSNKVKKELKELENEEVIETTADELLDEEDLGEVPETPEDEPKKEGFFKKVGKKVKAINWKKVGKTALALVAVGGIGYLTGVAVTRHKSEDESDDGEIPMLPDCNENEDQTDTWIDDSAYDSELTSTDDETVNEE